MTHLIAAALWVLLLPPVIQVDGEWTLPRTKSLAEWSRTDYMDTYAECRDRRLFKKRTLQRDAKWAYSHGMIEESKRYWLHSFQYSNGKCWPVKKVEEYERGIKGPMPLIYLQ